jgi:hypothetical protein
MLTQGYCQFIARLKQTLEHLNGNRFIDQRLKENI